jgi:hypothetical protein
MMNLSKTILFTAVLAGITGCATPYHDLPVHQATVTDARQSLYTIKKPPVVEDVRNAFVRPDTGAENRKMLAGELGILNDTRAVAAGVDDVVVYSQVAFRDDATQEEFRGALNGQWVTGMKLRYSVTPDNKIVVR